MKRQFYTLYDIDGNNTDELLLGVECVSGGIGLGAVYSIQNNVVVKQEEFVADIYYSSPSDVLFKNGTIRSESYDAGELNVAYFCFEDGELKFQTLLLDSRGNYYRMHVQFGSLAPITKEEYDRLRKEYEGDGQLAALDWKPLEEYGR